MGSPSPVCLVSRDINRTRREVLRTSGATIGVGVLASLSGCAGFLQSGGPGDYRNWAFSPSAISQDHYWTLRLDASSLHEARHEFSQEFFDSIRGTSDSYVGMRFDEFDRLLITAGGLVSVGAGEYEVDQIVERARDEGYGRGEDYEGYQIYTLEGEESIAISEEDILVALETPQHSSAGLAKIAIDTARGEERRYHEDNSHFEAVTDALDAKEITYVYTHEPHDETKPENGQFRNKVGSGMRFDVNGETTDALIATAFRSEQDVDRNAIRSWTDTADGWEKFYDVKVETDGAIATVSGTVDTRDIDGSVFY